MVALALSLLTSVASAQPAPVSPFVACEFLGEQAEGEYNLVYPIDAGADVTLVFDCIDETRLSLISIARGKLGLSHVVDGERSRVAKLRAIRLTGATELVVQRRADRIRAIAGRRVLLDLLATSAPGGRVGVVGGTLDDLLLQPVDDAHFDDDFTRDATEMAAWTTCEGVFRNTVVQATGADPTRSANPFSLGATGEPTALALAGDWYWDSYRVSTSARPTTATMIGLLAYAQDERNYIALQWDEGSEREAGARRLVEVRDGVPRVLAEARGGYVRGEWYRLEVRIGSGRIEALIDRDSTLTASTNAFGQGVAGLLAREGLAMFDDVHVRDLDAPDAAPLAINPAFVQDDVMAAQQVYLSRGFWTTPTPDGHMWNWGRFYDDAVFDVPSEQLDGRQLQVVIRPTLGNESADTVLTLAGDSGKIRASAGGQMGEAILQPGEPLRVSLGGNVVIVDQAGPAIITVPLPASDTGREIALRNATPQAPDQVSIESSHFRDYTFSSGPTDWYQGKGVWDVTSRWHCEPGWTFLGGTGDPNPVIWTKHAYSGDMVLEFFAGIRMEEDLVGNPYPYIHPGDINATICGDGSSLDSGYSFIFAGWNNTKTAILRNGEVVAENPDFVIANPSTRDAFHRHWFRIRIEKLGDTIRYWVDGEPAIEYTDREPLNGGRVGLWTFQNDLMVARARLWFESEEQPGGVVRVLRLAATSPDPTARDAAAPFILDDFESGVGEWSVSTDAAGAVLAIDDRTSAGGKRSLRVTNADEGGSFTVWPVTTPFRASEWSVLSFDYRLPAETKLNLYLFMNGDWHALELSAEEPADSSAIPLGRIPDIVADGTWRHASVDIEAALAAAYPQFSAFQIGGMVLAPPWSSYTRCGIGGNGRGTTYWIDNFRIGSS